MKAVATHECRQVYYSFDTLVLWESLVSLLNISLLKVFAIHLIFCFQAENWYYENCYYVIITLCHYYVVTRGKIDDAKKKVYRCTSLKRTLIFCKLFICSGFWLSNFPSTYIFKIFYSEFHQIKLSQMLD